MSENNNPEETRRPSSSDVSETAEPTSSGVTPDEAAAGVVPESQPAAPASAGHSKSSSPSSGSVAGSTGGVPPSSTPLPKTSGRGGLALLWLLVLLLVAAVGYLGWQHWLMYSSGDLAARQQVLNRLEQNWTTMDGELSDVRRDLETRFVQAEQRATVRDEAVRERLQEQQVLLNELTSSGRSDWVLSEVDYLIRLASHRLLVDRDVVVATTLLQSVDQLLQELDDPQSFRLRQALASDLSALRLVERVDRTGLYLRIDALQQAVADLPLERHLHERGEPLVLGAESGEVDPAEPTWWQSTTTRLKAAWHHLDGYIRIYRRDEAIEPLLSPDEELYLRLNLRLMLEQAQWALLQQEQGAFEISLSKAHTWLDDYFVADDRNQALQDELNALSEQTIVQVLPNLDDSLNAIRQVLRAQTQQGGQAESSP